MAKYTLSNMAITQMCQGVEDYLKQTSIASKEQIRIMLTLEEVLLQYQTQFGEAHSCHLRYGKEWGRPRISLSVAGAGLNPFAQDEESASTQILRNLLNNMGLEPAWQYANGANVVYWVLPKKKRSPFANLLAAIVLAIICGLISYLWSDAAVEIVATWVSTPLFNTFMGVLQAVSGPLIFLSVACGIYSIGDATTFGRIGKLTAVRFLLVLPVISLLSCAWLLLVFKTSDSVSSFSMDAVFELYQMVLDIVPGNIVAPFSDNNPMQIICLAIVIGFAILVLGKKTTVAATCLEQTSFIVQYIMECVSNLVPAIVFISIFNMFLTRQFAVLYTAYKPILCMVGCCVLMGVLYAAWVSITCKVPVFMLVKKLMPTFIIGVTTDSSSAAFSTNVETCEKKLGIDPKIVNFGLPLGQVVYMTGAAILFVCMAFFMAESYQVEITAAWLVMAFLVTCFVAIAAPPIPGGALTCYTLIFTQLGIPTEAVAMAIVLNVLMGCLATGSNLYALQCELTLLSNQLHMIDKDVLRKA